MKKLLVIQLILFVCLLHGKIYGAAMSSYPTASSVVDGDKALISKSTASNATQQAAMSTIKDYVLSDVIDFSATSPLNFNPTTGVLSLTPWASQSALETWLGWSFSGSGGGEITVSSSLPTVAGSATLNDSTHVLTVASDTGYTQFTGSFTAWDTTPAAFGFGTITDAVAGQEYCWTTPVTVADINRPATVSSTADSYKINGSTSTATSIALSDTFTPCMTASSTPGANVSGNMAVGGVAGDPVFSVTTSGVAWTISDNFSVDDTSPLGNWTKVTGTGVAIITGGVIKTVDYNAPVSYQHNFDIGSKEMTVQGDVCSGSGGNNSGLVVRSDGTNGYNCILNAGSNRFDCTPMGGTGVAMYVGFSGSWGSDACHLVQITADSNNDYTFLVDFNNNGIFDGGIEAVPPVAGYAYTGTRAGISFFYGSIIDNIYVDNFKAKTP